MVADPTDRVTFRPYIAAYPPCSGRPLPGSANLQLALLERFNRSSDLGIYNCRPLSTNTAVPSIHSDGRAGDLGFPVYGGAAHGQGFLAVGLLSFHAWALGIMGIIFNRTRWDSKSPRGRPYYGPNPHLDHVHWEQIPSIASTLSYSYAAHLIGDPMAAFTDAEIAALIRLAPYADTLVALSRGLLSPGPSTGRVGNGFSLIHLLEAYRVVSELSGISPTDHRAMGAFLAR